MTDEGHAQVNALEVEDDMLELEVLDRLDQIDEDSMDFESLPGSDHSDIEDNFVVVEGEDDRESFETARMELGVPA